MIQRITKNHLQMVLHLAQWQQVHPFRLTIFVIWNNQMTETKLIYFPEYNQTNWIRHMSGKYNTEQLCYNAIGTIWTIWLGEPRPNKLISRAIKRRGTNTMWSSDPFWWQRPASTFAQVLACCLTAPQHYLNWCWHQWGIMTFTRGKFIGKF